MPLYEYSCPSCGRFSALRPMAQHSQPQPCPQCGVISARVLSGVALIGSSSGADRGSGLGGGTPGRYRHMGGCSCC
jgi:putative FmdB family regulatory protein